MRATIILVIVATTIHSIKVINSLLTETKRNTTKKPQDISLVA